MLAQALAGLKVFLVLPRQIALELFAKAMRNNSLLNTLDSTIADWPQSDRLPIGGQQQPDVLHQ